MFFKRKKQDDKKEKVIISFTRKLGMVCLRSLEEYIEKNKIAKCCIIIPNPPHQNVINYAENISQIEIVIAPTFFPAGARAPWKSLIDNTTISF